LPPELRARLRLLRCGHAWPAAPVASASTPAAAGAGLEFAQYRAYEPGDELRQIDWKLYARSDRFFVRESERESPITVWLLLDATASAGQADRAAPQRTRLDHMRGVAACLVELALQQGDRFGLLAINGDGLQLVPAANGARQRDRVHLQLHALQARGSWPPPIDCARCGNAAPGRPAAGDRRWFDEAGIVLLERWPARAAKWPCCRS
jgi:hypothetical protein